MTGLNKGIVIRPYEIADLTAIVGLARELQDHDHALYPLMIPSGQIGPWYVERLLQDATRFGGMLLVAWLDHRVAGYASLWTNVDNEDPDEVPNSYSYVSDLVVARGLHGRGIGQALLAQCEALAKAAGQKHLRLNVLAGNDGARRFYRAWGFSEHLLTLNKAIA